MFGSLTLLKAFVNEPTITRSEFVLFWMLLLNQDRTGLVVSSKWSEWYRDEEGNVKILGLSRASIFNARSGLEAKGHIKLIPTDIYGEYDIQILHFRDKVMDDYVLELSMQGAVVDPKGFIKKKAKATGGYFNFKGADYEYISIINSLIAQRLPVKALQIALEACFKHSQLVSMRKGKNIKTYDIRLSIEYIAKMFGFDMDTKEARKKARSRIKRYFNAIVASGLLPVYLDENYSLCIKKEDFDKFPSSANLPTNAEMVNGRVIDNITKRMGAPIDSNDETAAQDIADTLKVVNSQFNKMFNLMLTAKGVQRIVSECISKHGAIIPRAINILTKKFMETFDKSGQEALLAGT